MKQIYAIPMVDVAGTVLRETISGGGPLSEAEEQKPLGTGRVGYYL